MMKPKSCSITRSCHRAGRSSQRPRFPPHHMNGPACSPPNPATASVVTSASGVSRSLLCQSPRDEFGGNRAAFCEAEERAEVPSGSEARQVQAREAGLERLVEHREPVGDLNAVEHPGKVRHAAESRLVAGGQDDPIDAEFGA